MKKRALALGLVFALMLGILPAFAATSPFSDVPSNHWGIDGIIAAYNDGVMTGTYVNSSTGERRFSPASHLTLAEWAVMLYRAFYADEPFTVPQENWWNREAAVLSAHHIFGASMSQEQASTPVNRFQMAMMICSLLEDKGVIVDAAKVEAAKKEITDLNEMYPMHQEPVATCWALGIIKGVGANRFNGEGKMERAQAATVYLRVKNVLASAPIKDDTPPAPTWGPVGTMSATEIDWREYIKTAHDPVVDYWSQQPLEIRNISDRDAFNAACQTLHDSKLISTQGEFGKWSSINLYYNYAVVATKPGDTQENTLWGMGNLMGYGGSYGRSGGYKSGSKYCYCSFKPLRTATTSAPRFASTIAQIKANPGMSDRQKAELCIKAVCDQIDYEVSGGASWDNGKPTGDCESYALMLERILSSAGIPSLHISGRVAAGNHAWVQVKLDGQWYVMDGTITEGNPSATVFTFAEHEKAYAYNGVNDADMYKVARALIDAAYPTDYEIP